MRREAQRAVEGRMARRAGERRLRVAVGFAAFGLLLALPRPGSDGARVLAPAEAEVPTCRPGRACPEPGREGWVARIESVLELRAAALPETTRRRIARAVVDEAREASLDPLLAAAIIDVESGFDVRARSYAGARGLMQLLPETMAREAARAGMAAGDPDDPVANVRLGIRYFRRLLDLFVTEELALMAYNAGPNRIGELLLHGRIPSRLRAYPAHVLAEHRRLQQGFGILPTAALARADGPDAVR